MGITNDYIKLLQTTWIQQRKEINIFPIHNFPSCLLGQPTVIVDNLLVHVSMKHRPEINCVWCFLCNQGFADVSYKNTTEKQQGLAKGNVQETVKNEIHTKSYNITISKYEVKWDPLLYDCSGDRNRLKIENSFYIYENVERGRMFAAKFSTT